MLRLIMENEPKEVEVEIEGKMVKIPLKGIIRDHRIHWIGEPVVGIPATEIEIEDEGEPQ